MHFINKTLNKFDLALTRRSRIAATEQQLKEINKTKAIMKYFAVDFVVSVGSACRTAFYLREAGLRQCTNPLDWMYRYSLNSVLDLFKTEFNSFFVDVEDITPPKESQDRHIRDKTTGMISLHDFSQANSINDELESFHKNMERRFRRMQKCILLSDKVLFVCNRQDSEESLLSFITSVYEMYKVPCVLLNIRHSTELSGYFVKNINNDITFIEYTFNDIHADGSDPIINKCFWHGNKSLWIPIMNTITISNKLNSFIRDFQ
ncbi:DUF1796 family putative cysteine peptidase [Desulfovibrio litoralis]|uniref:Putative papain-like cysteine peptidase n=1 Tax=Desulfovibrio litoralis DSM 11393 TaxID=1121455 RepID=A0A1M7SMC3_9BACT|nr:DUF1796 family putative cysteine peptidase [Desulfovibrio litoralis]SHN59606.1 Putative papain-like cysteine peptidase [Desulfovibrio litoralis DSM 11393]